MAEKASRKALSEGEKVFEPHHPSVIRSQRRLATILKYSERYDQAESYIMSALNEQKHLIGTTDKTTLLIIQRLFFIQHAQNKYVETKKTAEENLKATTAIYDLDHIDTQQARYVFAYSLIVNSKIEEAETILLSLIEFIERKHSFEPDHEYNFVILKLLSSIRMTQSRYIEASRLQSTT